MNVIAAARSIGLTSDRPGGVSGTIDQDVVLALLAELAVDDPANDDLIADAAMQVRRARSAGVVDPDTTSVFARYRTVTVQLRYRSEMAAVFTDLAIDVGLRQARQLAELPG